ncbi:MFS transporter [Neobacillus cucumis]|uniref:MFS transporter n=1 Tax=Neobacillus cucumis TaxID=1740721 RepID=UPI002E221472|nr:MFS transporter [Neobacillus cucumis]
MKTFQNFKKIYLLIGVLFVAQILNFIDKSAINFAIIPISKDLKLSSETAGLVLSSFFLAYGIMQFVGGYLADKFGIKKVLPGAVILWSIATCLTGLSRSAFSLISSRLLVGVGEGAYPASCSVAIVDNFQRKARARAKSVISAGASVGFAVGSIICTLLITSIGWKWMFLFLGFLGLAIAVLLWSTIQEHDKKEEAKLQKKSKDKSIVKASLKNPLVWKLMVAACFTNMVFWGLQSWLPSYWINVKHMDMVSMGMYSSVPYILGFFSFLLSGWLLDKFLAGREKFIFVICGFLSALFIYLMFNTQSIPLAFAYLSLSNVFLNALNITVFVVPMKYISENSVGTATGIINTGGQIGSTITPTVIGYLISAFNQNYNAAFMFLVASSIVVLIIGLTVNTKRGSMEEPNSLQNAQ